MLLEVLLSVTIGMMVICGAFGISAWCVRTFVSSLADIEEKEYALSAIHAVFHFVRYGSNVVPVENGKKLHVLLGNNLVTLYRSGGTFFLGYQRGTTANPLAGDCADAVFTLSGNLLKTTLAFRDRTYVLEVAPEYFTK